MKSSPALADNLMASVTSFPAGAPASPAAIGQHVLADLHGVAPERLVSEQQLMTLLLDSLRSAGFHVIGRLSHKFPGEASGVTGMVLLAESHAAFHTYPEHGYLALDLFTCGQPNPDEVLQAVVAALQPTQVNLVHFPRGARGGDGL